MSYTLQLKVTGPFSLSPDDATLELLEHGQSYPLRSITENDGFDPDETGQIWTNATSSTHEVVSVPQKAHIIITGDVIGGSQVWVNDHFAGRFETFSWSQMAFVVPLDVFPGGLSRT